MILSKRVLFLAKKNDEWSKLAFEKTKRIFPDTTGFFGEWGDPIPDEAMNWRGDYIFSYLSRWILPKSLLGNVREYALNFHPAPPEFPGVGCLNFALYEDVREYGTTCHLMASKVDTGPIIEVVRFPVYQMDDVESLLSRTYRYQFDLFEKVLNQLSLGGPLEIDARELWSNDIKNRSDLNKLSELEINMNPEEMKRRIRATNYNNFKSYIKINGLRFEYAGET